MPVLSQPKLNDHELAVKNEENVEFIEKSIVPPTEPVDVDDTFEYKEGGWGWLVVIACGFCFGILIGMVNNYALIYNGLDEAYKNTTENHVVYTGNFKQSIFHKIDYKG
jgi:hypothetical protein